MSMKIGFDNEKYLSEQTSAIIERVRHFDNKLYLEFGGKLLFDYHAARVLPGFDPNVEDASAAKTSGQVRGRALHLCGGHRTKEGSRRFWHYL